MELKALKESIESKNILSTFIIFDISKGNDFIPLQYIKEISKIISLPIIYIDSLDYFTKPQINIFDKSENVLKIYRCEEFNILNNNLFNASNLIIITSKIPENIRKEYSYNIVEIPKLENWQIKDFANSLGKNIEEKDLDYLIENSNYNIYRIYNEIIKLKDLPPEEQKIIFKRELNDNLFSISKYNIFDILNNIQSKDISNLKDIFNKIKLLNIDYLGLINLLCQSFKNIALVWLNKNPTPENTGLKSTQIWAIKNIPHKYSQEQIIKILSFLTELDYKIKSGNIDLKPSLYLDYIILKLLSF